MGELALSGERRVLGLIAAGGTLPVVLDAICALIEDPPRLCASVYVLDRDARMMSFTPGPAGAEPWRIAMLIVPNDATAVACGAALAGREPVVVDDMQAS